MKAKATYTVKKWTESTIEQPTAHTKSTRASVEYALTGGIEGTASVEYLMFYRQFDEKDAHRSQASYVGLIGFKGSVSGKNGSFLMADRGTFEGGAATSTLEILEGSGTGALENISGSGSYRADRDGFRIELDYEI